MSREMDKVRIDIAGESEDRTHRFSNRALRFTTSCSNCAERETLRGSVANERSKWSVKRVS
jgi:hypothetical protein